MDPSDLKPEHGAFTAIGAAAGAVLARLFPRRRGDGESKAERELREVREELVSQKIAAVRQELQGQLADLLRENGRQAEQIKTLQHDVNNLWRRLRGEKTE